MWTGNDPMTRAAARDSSLPPSWVPQCLTRKRERERVGPSAGKALSAGGLAAPSAAGSQPAVPSPPQAPGPAAGTTRHTGDHNTGCTPLGRRPAWLFACLVCPASLLVLALCAINAYAKPSLSASATGTPPTEVTLSWSASSSEAAKVVFWEYSVARIGAAVDMFSVPEINVGTAALPQMMTCTSGYSEAWVYGKAAKLHGGRCWVRVAADTRSVTFTRSDVHLYDFQVQAANRDGQYGEPSDKRRIQVTGQTVPQVNRPAISGTPRIGETLTVNVTGRSIPAGMKYEWRRYGPEGSYSTTNVGGVPGTSSSYTLREVDFGTTVEVHLITDTMRWISERTGEVQWPTARERISVSSDVSETAAKTSVTFTLRRSASDVSAALDDVRYKVTFTDTSDPLQPSSEISNYQVDFAAGARTTDIEAYALDGPGRLEVSVEQSRTATMSGQSARLEVYSRDYVPDEISADSVTEGEAATFTFTRKRTGRSVTVYPEWEMSANVRIRGTLPDSLYFSRSQTTRTVTVQTVENVEDNSDAWLHVTLAHFAGWGIRIWNIETRKLVMTPLQPGRCQHIIGHSECKALRISPGGTGMYKLKLGTNPGKTVTIKLNPDGGKITLDTDKVTFTETDWNVDQTVTVQLASDADPVRSHRIVHRDDPSAPTGWPGLESSGSQLQGQVMWLDLPGTGSQRSARITEGNVKGAAQQRQLSESQERLTRSTRSAPAQQRGWEAALQEPGGTGSRAQEAVTGWSQGQWIYIDLTFDSKVTVDTNAGRPGVQITLGGTTERRAAYRSGSGTETLRFGYQVTPGDGVVTRVEVDANALSLNGGTITAQNGGQASITHAAFTYESETPQRPTGPEEEDDKQPIVVTPPLTAKFRNVPPEHDGSSAFDLELHFSAAPRGLSYKTLRGDSFFNVTNGTVTKAKRLVRKDNSGWRVTVEPDSSGDVTIGLLPALPTADCAEAAVVCTADGTRLSVGLATFVSGPTSFSVQDAAVQEGPNATLDFVVTLSRARHEATTVAYATSDGTATAGADYTSESGTLTFAIGETEQTVSVTVLDDVLDDDGETVTLTLSTASAPTRITRDTATGTIENADPLPQAWLARFGRTVGTHVVDAVGERLRGAPGQGSHLTIGGQRLPLGTRGADTEAPDGAADGVSGVERLVQALGQRLGLSPGPASAGSGGTGTDPWAAQPGMDPRLGQSPTLNFNLRQILLGSSFRLAFGANDADSSHPRLTAWGRFAGTTFDGKDGDLTLDGDVFTGTVGVDGEWDRVLAGVAVAHSRGEGSFSMAGLAARGQGDLENTLTSIHPYLRYAVTDRLDVWGLLGYGWGQLELAQDPGDTLETDTTLVMGAVGGRGILLAAADSGGFQVATRTDAMLTRTTSDAVTGLASSDADAHRLRVILEGSRGFTWAHGRTLTPTVELGVRHDWGDAETGFGLELGGRIRYTDPTLGLTIEGTVRGLLAHEDAAYEEWGASGNIHLAPGPGGQGLALTLAPTWGATASGVDGLWARQTTAGLVPTTSRAPTGRLSAEVGYGVPAPFGTGLLTPYAGTVLAEGAARTWRLGTRLQLTSGPATGLTLNLEGTRQDPAGQQPVNQGLRLQATWGF